MIFLQPAFPYFNTFHILDRHRLRLIRLRFVGFRFVGFRFVGFRFVRLRFIRLRLVGLIGLESFGVVSRILILIDKDSLDPQISDISSETIICHEIIHCRPCIRSGIKGSENAAPGIDRNLCAVFDLLKFCACFHFPFQCRDPRSAVP